MKMEISGETLRISGVKELSAATANRFRDHALAVFEGALTHIEIDLSETLFVDSCGLGTLLSLHKACQSRKGEARLRNPSPPIDQVLELTRLERVLDIIRDGR